MKAYITKQGAFRHNVLIGTEIEFDRRELDRYGYLEQVYHAEAGKYLYNISVFPFASEADASAIAEPGVMEQYE